MPPVAQNYRGTARPAGGEISQAVEGGGHRALATQEAQWRTHGLLPLIILIRLPKQASIDVTIRSEVLRIGTRRRFNGFPKD
jgi:hypothetical protein